MKARSCSWCALIFAVLTSQAASGAASAALVISKDAGLCSTVLADTKRQLRGGVYLNGKSSLAAGVDWRQVLYPFVGFEGHEVTLSGITAEVDIDNDEQPETLLLESTMLRSESADVLFVFKNGQQPSTQRAVTYKERTAWAGIYSLAPWPYLSQGLSMVSIQVLSYRRRNYLLLTDAQFGRRLGRSVVVARYRGNAIKEHGEYPTDDFETICRISQK